jgi:hypothetical protein
MPFGQGRLHCGAKIQGAAASRTPYSKLGAKDSTRLEQGPPVVITHAWRPATAVALAMQRSCEPRRIIFH